MSALADSWLPDNDQSGFNNSFERAEIIDALRIGPNGQPRGVHVTGALGIVIGGFDTEDYYKFSIPGGTRWKLNFFMKELPDTTVAIEVFDRPGGGDPIARGQGNPVEFFTLELAGGTYYLRIFTSPGSANGRHVTYDLAITPTFLPIPDTPGPDCKTGSDLSSNPDGRRVQGTLDPSNPTASYRFYLTVSGTASVTRFHTLFDQQIDVIDRNDGGRFMVAGRGRPRPDLHYLLDPGFYCLQIFNRHPVPPINYDVALSLPLGALRPGPSTEEAPFVTELDVGIFSQNGLYKGTRYVRGDNHLPPALDPFKQYTLREWIGTNEAEQWLKFSIPRSGKLTSGLYRLYRPVGLEILDEIGRTIAVGQSSGVPPLDFLPPVQLEARIAAGVYYVRLTSLSTAGPGTSYVAAFTYSPDP
ncbi:MAG: hypothetical protein AB7U61_15160 [Methylocystis sp.]